MFNVPWHNITLEKLHRMIPLIVILMKQTVSMVFRHQEPKANRGCVQYIAGLLRIDLSVH